MIILVVCFVLSLLVATTIYKDHMKNKEYLIEQENYLRHNHEKRCKLENDMRNYNIEKYKIPDKKYRINYIKGHPFFSESLRCFCWLENDAINIVDSDLVNCKGGVEIPIKDIKSFLRQGDVYTETNISGGGGGGSSIKGAIIGEVIAGPVGAVVGSRKANDPIKTENKVVDKRLTILEYYCDNKLNYMFFSSNSYNIFLDLIPFKEINFVNREDTNDSKIYDKLRKLAKLKDDGILTEEEFISKKKCLLDNII